MTIKDALVNTVLAITVLLLSTAVWYGMLSISQDRRVPVSELDARFLEKSASPGQAITLEVSRTVNRWCAGLVHEWWMHEASGLRIQGAVRPAGALRVSEPQYATSQFKKHVPANAPAGTLCYSPILIYDCPNRQYSVMQPPACIEVLSQ